MSGSGNGNAPTPPGLDGASTAHAASVLVGEQLAEHLEGLSVAELHSELAEATAHTAKARADYADALVEKQRVLASKDLYALGVATEAAKARLADVRVDEARASAIRAALRATKDQQRSDDEFVPIPERYVDVEDFVTQYLSPVVQRKLGGGVVWCPKWWKHPEAVNRLWALWRAFEMFRSQGGSAMSSWWVYHADVHLSVLLDERGPFVECRGRKGHIDSDHSLPVERAPEGWWTVLSGDLDTPVTYEASDHDDPPNHDDERSRP